MCMLLLATMTAVFTILAYLGLRHITRKAMISSYGSATVRLHPRAPLPGPRTRAPPRLSPPRASPRDRHKFGRRKCGCHVRPANNLLIIAGRPPRKVDSVVAVRRVRTS